jgi:hypothetical protein
MRRTSFSDIYESLQRDPDGDSTVNSLFEKLDTDHAGYLSTKEFTRFVVSFFAVGSEDGSKSEKVPQGVDSFVKSLFDEVDENGDGKITRDELAHYFQKNATRWQTAPTVHLLDNVPVKVLRESPSWKFESGKLHVLLKHARNTSTKEIPLAAGRACLLHTDSGYGKLYQLLQLLTLRFSSLSHRNSHQLSQ